MPISLEQAKELCTQDEFKLVETSFPPAVEGITPARLRQKIARSRRLQDKYRDLSRRQNRGTKASDTSRARASNERTAQKAELFVEVRERFENRLGALESRAAS
jgi:hypothetical protein